MSSCTNTMADPVEVSPGRWQVRVFINRHNNTEAP
jgi:hypothetical protein